MKLKTCAALAVTLACLVNTATAAVITPVSGTSVRNQPRIQYSYDGSGLDDSDPDVLNWTAAASYSYLHEAYEYGTEVTTFDLGATYDLTNIYFWNYNNSGGELGRQVTSFDYEVSADNVSWSTPVNTGALPTQGSIGPQSTTDIPVALTNVQYIRFSNFATVSDPQYVGFNEVRFESGAVPEPSSFALAALGLAGLGWFGIRRRKR